MKISIDKRRRQSGIAAAILLVILVVVIAVVIIFGIAWSMLKAIQRITPPPPPDQFGHIPGIGDVYDGGIIIAYTNISHRDVSEVRDVSGTNPVVTAYIYSSDQPWPGQSTNWTNLLWTGPWADLTNQLGSNGLPVESFPTGMPPQRFYNIMVQTN